MLAAVEQPHAGVGSAVNNAFARVAGLLTVAAIGARPFGLAMSLMATLLWFGGAISALGIEDPPRGRDAHQNE